jgi:CRISPR/Cas system CMR-associated protein Cmr1 (group 7 of RAMP superfamily)
MEPPKVKMGRPSKPKPEGERLREVKEREKEEIKQAKEELNIEIPTALP